MFDSTQSTGNHQDDQQSSTVMSVAHINGEMDEAEEVLEVKLDFQITLNKPTDTTAQNKLEPRDSTGDTATTPSNNKSPDAFQDTKMTVSSPVFVFFTFPRIDEQAGGIRPFESQSGKSLHQISRKASYLSCGLMVLPC